MSTNNFNNFSNELNNYLNKVFNNSNVDFSSYLNLIPSNYNEFLINIPSTIPLNTKDLRINRDRNIPVSNPFFRVFPKYLEFCTVVYKNKNPSQAIDISKPISEIINDISTFEQNNSTYPCYLMLRHNFTHSISICTHLERVYDIVKLSPQPNNGFHSNSFIPLIPKPYIQRWGIDWVPMPDGYMYKSVWIKYALVFLNRLINVWDAEHPTDYSRRLYVRNFFIQKINNCSQMPFSSWQDLMERGGSCTYSYPEESYILLDSKCLTGNYILKDRVSLDNYGIDIGYNNTMSFIQYFTTNLLQGVSGIELFTYPINLTTGFNFDYSATTLYGYDSNGIDAPWNPPEGSSSDPPLKPPDNESPFIYIIHPDKFYELPFSSIHFSEDTQIEVFVVDKDICISAVDSLETYFETLKKSDYVLMVILQTSPQTLKFYKIIPEYSTVGLITSFSGSSADLMVEAILSKLNSKNSDKGVLQKSKLNYTKIDSKKVKISDKQNKGLERVISLADGFTKYVTFFKNI